MLFFINSLNIFLAFYLFSIIISLTNLCCPIMLIFLNSINFYCFPIFLVHFCNMKLLFSIDELKIARLRIKLSTLQNIFCLFLFSFINFITFFILFRLFFIFRLTGSCFCFLFLLLSLHI